jgi:hypothetical protein
MKIAVLGTGIVGNTIGTKLIQLGHQVKMGSRAAKNEKAIAWVKAAGSNASEGSFADAAAFGEIIFNCTLGQASLDALKASAVKCSSTFPILWISQRECLHRFLLSIRIRWENQFKGLSQKQKLSRPLIQ